MRQRGIQRVLPALRCVLLVVWAPSLASAFGRLGNLFTRQATARALEEDEPECADSADPGAAQCKIWADAGERRQQPSQCTTSGGFPIASQRSQEPAELGSGSQASELWHRDHPLTVARRPLQVSASPTMGG